MTPQQNILKIISDNTAKTGNMTGISVVKISQKAGLPMKETWEVVARLCESGEVTAREGINEEIIFKNAKEQQI